MRNELTGLEFKASQALRKIKENLASLETDNYHEGKAHRWLRKQKLEREIETLKQILQILRFHRQWERGMGIPQRKYTHTYGKRKLTQKAQAEAQPPKTSDATTPPEPSVLSSSTDTAKPAAEATEPAPIKSSWNSTGKRWD